MNNYDWLAPRRRRQSLFVVEGNHEKNELISLLLKIFPEIDICLEDILIYGTNIYMLYEELVHIYQENWYEDDVDLPFLVSRKKGYEMPLYKKDFNNIVLIFDYERHEPNFSEDKIMKMQEYFHDATDVGKLFINYPMIESYQDLQTIPDDTYKKRYIPVTLQPGYQYKNLVKDTMIAKMTELPIRIKGILMGRFHIVQGMMMILPHSEIS
ncbi:MAG: hypothetical protein PHY47_24610 [Lachnospiraceae bacterium]|nr:hypothetical protein [Lachnospiraceae bacterium]